MNTKHSSKTVQNESSQYGMTFYTLHASQSKFQEGKKKSFCYIDY